MSTQKYKPLYVALCLFNLKPPFTFDGVEIEAGDFDRFKASIAHPERYTVWTRESYWDPWKEHDADG